MSPMVRKQHATRLCLLLEQRVQPFAHHNVLSFPTMLACRTLLKYAADHYSVVGISENVKELLEDVKNLSSLMLDLGYSSVFFESKDIAKEVLLLYSNLEELEERLYMHLFAASRGRPSERLISVIDLVESSKMVANSARNLSEMVLEGAALHPIVKEALAESDESITRVTIKGKSILNGRTIGELKMRTETGITAVAIRRGQKWIFNPKKDTQLLENDILIGIGPKASCDKLRKLASGGLRKV